MIFSDSNDLKNCRIGCCLTVDKQALLSSRGDIHHYVESRIRNGLVSQIQPIHTRMTEHEFHVEYRADVYVLSPDQLHRLIHEEALRLSRYYTQPLLRPLAEKE